MSQDDERLCWTSQQSGLFPAPSTAKAYRHLVAEKRAAGTPVFDQAPPQQVEVHDKHRFCKGCAGDATCTDN